MSTKLLMFYNVENLFPPDSDSPDNVITGLRNWDAYKYKQKIRKITNAFRFVEEDHGQLPSIIGLAEIGSKSVLEDLTDENSPLHSYGIIYEKSNDSRGLSVAMLYDKEKFSVLSFKTLRFPLGENSEYHTRDILQVELSSDGKTFQVFVLHLPSQRNRDSKKEQRYFIFQKLKETLEPLFDKGEPIVLMGDFNENPDSEAIKKICFDKMHNQLLINPFEEMFQKNQFSTFHDKQGMVFDQIIFTEKTLKERFNVKNIRAEIYTTPRLRNKDNKNGKYPFRTYSGSRFIGGYSDHFPVVIGLEG
ncbi:endonuclease [Epilithonimonas xixisoli]|uniref:Exonuclease III n=1 Tax=Epilithonimonas xixisoli TaxID=1476462 RepID=A0A4R8I873_9FLAO|nr:endonuclease [Epilithonimonas xixisoli]TDX86222.1 exonuclease III [Epilithonimonas xixisoli]